MKKVIIAGGSGFLGTELSKQLLTKGYEVVVLDIAQARFTHEHLSSVQHNLLDAFPDDYDNPLLKGADVVINLAGKNIFGRFTDEHKKLVYDTRVTGSRNLVDLYSRKAYKPKRFVSASAIGYYGNQPGEILDESSISKNGLFLSKVVKDWEQENLSISQQGVPSTCIRNGHIIGGGGVAQATASRVFLGIVPVLGSGKEGFPWIDIRDLIELYIRVSEGFEELSVINGVSNTFANQEDFSRAIKHALDAHILLSVPRFFMHLAYGSFADEMLVDLKVTSKHYEAIGFYPEYDILDQSINHHLSR